MDLVKFRTKQNKCSWISLPKEKDDKSNLPLMKWTFGEGWLVCKLVVLGGWVGGGSDSNENSAQNLFK